MKKIISLFGVVALTATAATAAPNYLQRGQDGVYKVTYDYTDRAEVGHWYIGGRLDLNLLNWENEYSSAAPDAADLDKSESFTEAVIGGGLSVGRTFDYFWRAEVEAGVIGQFEDDDFGTTFKMTVPYLMANGYYGFANDFYVGAGLGIALPKVHWQGAFFSGGDSTERNVSPMIGLMGGWSYKLDYNLVLDLRYRLAMFWGPEHEREFVHTDFNSYVISNDVGMVLDNSISVGLRYEF